MAMLSRLQERQARLLRWLLISGWMVLLVSLLIPAVPLQGNRLFWGTVVPAGVLIIGAISHELWRRLCPLAFVSQLAGALGLQRTRLGKGKKPELVMVKADSWLGRHHVELQWSLLIAGLCLRLLGANSDPHWLALWLLLTLLAAMVMGWAYGGKAWCQYVCPMGPVQTVLTGVRGPLGTTAHVAAPSRITQSMCRTLTEEGKERSACVACQTPCLDIDAERVFWQNLQGKRGLGWAWYSYPGLVAAFFSLMEWNAEDHGLDHPLGYIRSGIWAQDRGLADRALLPFADFGVLPRLLVIPLVLTAAAWLSVFCCRWVEGRLTRQGGAGVRSPGRAGAAATVAAPGGLDGGSRIAGLARRSGGRGSTAATVAPGVGPAGERPEAGAGSPPGGRWARSPARQGGRAWGSVPSLRSALGGVGSGYGGLGADAGTAAPPGTVRPPAAGFPP